MKAALRLLLVAALATTCAPAALAGGHTHAPNSVWKLNVAQSNFGGGPAFKSDEMTILTDTETWFKFTDVTVDGDGKTWKTSWSGPQDGTLKPVMGMPGAKAGFKTDDDSSHWENPDGSVSDCLLTQTPDKKHVTINCEVKMKDGKKVHQTLAYDRTK